MLWASGLHMHLTEMRPFRVGVADLTDKQSLVPLLEELWNTWQIHCLILLSLFLQVLLFLLAGMRRRSASSILRTVLWPAYLSADSVAVFVLGHLAVHASQPHHQLLVFWAPFVLLHLGGQETITAFSKQDSELWKRHLLNLVTQAAIAGFVVRGTAWPDRRLLAAMAVVAVSGFCKYSERILCLYLASPASLRSDALRSLSDVLKRQAVDRKRASMTVPEATTRMKVTLDAMLRGDPIEQSIRTFLPVQMETEKLGNTINRVETIMSVDVPVNRVETIVAVENLPDMFAEFLSSADRCRAYESVGALLVRCYQFLYTKNSLENVFYRSYRRFFRFIWVLLTRIPLWCSTWAVLLCTSLCTPFLLYPIFRNVSALIALVLFFLAKKENQHHVTSNVDITVSYILLVGAMVLELSSAMMFILSHQSFIRIPPPSCKKKKQWSQVVAQYNMINWHSMEDSFGMASIKKCILRWFTVDLLDVAQTPVTEDHTPIKELILDNLLGSGIRKQWNIASPRGRIALQMWMGKHQAAGPDSAVGQAKALAKSVSSGVDFPTSVLLWHIATELCYYYYPELGEDYPEDYLKHSGALSKKNHPEDNNGTKSDETKKHKQMSRELSNYIMYLVFKCDAMLSSNSQLVHDKAHKEISLILRLQDTLVGAKHVVMKLLNAMKKDQKVAIQMKKDEELANEPQNSMGIEIQMHDKTADEDGTTDSHMQELSQSAQAVHSSVLPRAYKMMQELNSIENEAERWGLIVAVWSEMLYYIAPRCGTAFHYEHLATGGELVTHVLLLMYILGPFLPTSGT